MKSFKLNPLAAVVSSLVVASMSQFSYSQTTDNSARLIEEEVVVTGFRKSLQNSIDVKRNADTIVEAISAEDIGGLPDVSIADSLARLPGVTTERTGGEAGSIQIRGLSGDFVFATLNGREQVSPAQDRTVEFNQYPAELLSEVAVYKTPKASLIEGGVAGTVELRTANPLDLTVGHKFHVSARGSYNDHAEAVSGAEDYGSRLTLSYQGKFLDDTLGVALGYARLDQGSVASEYNGLAWPGPVENSDDYIDLNNDGVEDSLASNGFELHQTGGQEIRDGYMASLQYQPNDSLSIQADYFLSEFESKTFSKGFIVQNLARFEIDNPVYASNGVDIIGGQFSMLESTRLTGPQTHQAPPNPSEQGFQVNSNDVTDTDDVESYGIEVKWEAESWEVSVDLSHSEANGRNEDGFVRAHLYGVPVQAVDDMGNPVVDDQGNPVQATNENGQLVWDHTQRTNDLSFAYLNQPGALPRITFNSDFTNINPANGPAVQLSTYERYPRINNDQLDAARVDAKFDINIPILSSVEFGARYSERHYVNSREVFVYSIYDGDISNFNSVTIPLTPDVAETATWDGDFSHFPSFADIDANAAFQRALDAGLIVDARGNPRDATPRARWGEGRPWSMSEASDVSEDVLAYYLMANIDTEVAGMSLTGNVGVRIVETDQSAIGIFPADPANGLPADDIRDDLGFTAEIDGAYPNGAAYIEEGIEYTDTLPSINLSLNLTDQDILRFAAAKVISRAPIDELANQVTQRYDLIRTAGGEFYEFSVNATRNPFLKPFKADQFDLSYEHYFEETEGALAVALYYKEIKNRQQTIVFENFDGWEAFGIDVAETYVGPPRRDDNGQPIDLGTEADVVNGDFTLSLNNDDAGYIQGIELSYTQTFTFLPEPFDGFGLTATYANVDSEITVENPATGDNVGELPLPGLAENSGNLTLFWGYEGFETRISANYQDEKVGELYNPAGGDGRITTFEAQTFVDFQMSYKFDFGLDILFQVSNLTDEQNKSFYGLENKTATIQQFGRQYYLGANYNFDL